MKKTITALRHTSAYTRLFCLAAIALILSALLAMTGCAGNSKPPEEIIKEGLAAQFDQIKNLDNEYLEKLAAETSEEENLQAFGVSTKELCSAWLAGFDYSIDEIAVDGDTATAEITIHLRSLPSAVESWEEEVTEYVNDPRTASIAEEKMNAEIGTMFMTRLTKEPVQENAITLPYEKDSIDGSWRPADGFEEALGEAFIN